MYELDRSKIAHGTKKVTDQLARLQRVPLVVPLDADTNGIWHYRVLGLRDDNTHSDHVASFGISNAKEFAGCTCEAGQREAHCYHVAWAHGVHVTYVQMGAELRRSLI